MNGISDLAYAPGAERGRRAGMNSTGSWEGDVNITIAASLDYLPNLWTLGVLYGIRGDRAVEDRAEVGLMGFEPFRNATAPTLAEALQRPLYTTANLLHLALLMHGRRSHHLVCRLCRRTNVGLPAL